MHHPSANTFKTVDVTEDIAGRNIRDIIKINYHQLPKGKNSYRTANGSWLHITDGKDGDCTVSFYYRSWRYVNVTFNVPNHKL